MTSKPFGFSFRVCLFLLLLAVSSAPSAAAFSNIYIFGDSLSDTTAGPTGNGISNGGLWPVYFSQNFGMQYNSGNNFAVAGATTYDVISQVGGYLEAAGVADPNALYVLWAGGNDLQASGDPVIAAQNMISAVTQLSLFGANKFLVPNLPDMGKVPGVAMQGDGIAGAMTLMSTIYNSTIGQGFSASPNVRIADVFGFHQAAYANPNAFGFSNVKDSCLFEQVDCGSYFFWDVAHPTTAGHSFIANAFTATVIPIPAAAWLFGSGLLGLVSISRRKRV